MKQNNWVSDLSRKTPSQGSCFRTSIQVKYDLQGFGKLFVTVLVIGASDNTSSAGGLLYKAPPIVRPFEYACPLPNCNTNWHYLHAWTQITFRFHVI
jgi:hypothetical protein